jgi:NAD(P)-dependent dehydrogenase (short-subunit alcohol dehydrogenase family)
LADPQDSVRILSPILVCSNLCSPQLTAELSGYSAAEATVESGGNVYIGSSNPERVESAVKSLESTIGSGSGSVQGRAIDLRSDESVRAFVDWVAADTDGGKQEGVDHLIFTAGDPLMLGDLLETDLEGAKVVSPSSHRLS